MGIGVSRLLKIDGDGQLPASQQTLAVPRFAGRSTVSQLLYCSTAASSAITNTSTETLFDTSYTLPANTLAAGRVLRITFHGRATATNSTDTLRCQLYLGGLTGTAILDCPETDVANDDIFFGQCYVVCRTDGTSGTFIAFGDASTPDAETTSATMRANYTASTAINTQATFVIGVSATWSAASTSDSCRLENLIVELL